MNKDEKQFVTSYEDPTSYSSKKTIKRYRGAMIIVSLIAIGLISVFGYKAYLVSKVDPFEKPGSTLAQDYFLESAKTYFEFDPSKLPSTAGSCTTVALKTVQEENLISEINYYNKCDNNVSLVKACKLESGAYHFEVNMQCENNQTNIAYGEEQELTDDSTIVNKSDVKVYFSYQAQQLNTQTSTIGEKTTMWKDEIPDENYKIVKETTYYRYRDKNWKWQGDVRLYYPQDRANTELVSEYYSETPDENYQFKETTQNYAYKWYIQNEGGPRRYYPSGSSDVEEEKTYYVSSPLKGAKRDETTKTYAYKFYRVITTDESDLLPGKPSPSATKIEGTETWSAWSEYSLTFPKTAPFGEGNREVETRVKVEVVPIIPEAEQEIEWSQITSSYVSESELVSELKKLGYSVQNLEEIESLPDIKYEIRQTYREPIKG